MNGEELFNAITKIDDDIIENRSAASTKKTSSVRIGIVIASVVCVFIIAIASILVLIKKQFRSIPTYDHAHFSASEIASMAGMDHKYLDNSGTRSYTTIFVPDAEYLHIKALPDTEYITVYQFFDKKKPVSESSLKSFSNMLYDGLCEALDVQKEELKNEVIDHSDGGVATLDAECGKYRIRFSQNDRFQSAFILSYSSKNPGGVIKIYGNEISVDQRLSDDEIVSSLQVLNKQLCSIFKADLPDIKVVRKYDGYSEHGATWIRVFFYNKLNTPDDSMINDRIQLSFDNMVNYSGDVVSDSILSNVNVYYYHFFTDKMEPVANVRLLSLKEAESLLYSGCVFGMHACPLCMAEQPEVDFHNYDYVDVRYVNGVPFYAFFKKLDLKTSNGNLAFASTYVPAFEVSGLKEYFESQKSSHE